MRLQAIRMRHVRKFGRSGIAIEGIPPGLSMLSAPNEFGKSTLFDALRTALFQKHSSSRDEIRKMASVDGAAPLVEIDFAVGDDRYRLRKRFLKQPLAELEMIGTGDIVKSDDEAHSWMIDLIGAEKAGEGPTGLLWVEQGSSMMPPEAGEPGKTLLAGLLEQEVGEVTGGERARVLLKRVQDELGALVTQRGQPRTGPYKSAVTDLADVESQIAEAESDLAEAESLLAELTQLGQSILSLEDPEQSKRINNELSSAREKLSAAREANKTLEVLKGRLSDKASAKARCQEDLDAYRQQVKEAKTLGQTLDSRQKTKSEAKEDEERLGKALGQARANEQKAEKRRQKAEKTAKLCARAERESTAREKSKGLEQALKKAKKASDQLSSLQGQLRSNQVDDDALNEIRGANQKLDRQQARLEAARPRLTPLLSEQGQKVVKMDGKSLSGPVHLSGQKKLSLGNLGKIVIEANDSAKDKAKHDEAREALADLLLEYGLESVEEAERMAIKRREAGRQAERAQLELEQIAPDGLQSLEENYKAQVALLADDLLDETVVKGLPKRQEADLEWESARNHYDEARDNRESSETNHAEAVAKLKETKAIIAQLEERSAALYEQIGEPAAWDGALDKMAKALEKAASEEKSLRDEIEGKEASIPSLENAEAEVNRLETAKGNLAKNLQDKKIREAEAKRDLAAISEEGPEERLANLRQKHDDLARRVGDYEAHVAALQLLEDKLVDSQESLQDIFLKPVLSELRPLLEMVLPGAEISLGDDFNAHEVQRAGRSETVDSLSGGTREQIAVLTRLAFAQLMAKRGREMPVILDDALVWCDDSRIENVFQALHLASREIQCIVMTCHEKAFTTLGAPLLEVKKWPETG